MENSASGEKEMTYVYLLLRVIISGVFIYASIHKIIHPLDFAKQVALFEILPISLIYPFSFTLPILELICGLLIWIPKTRIPANLLNAFMVVLFIIAISYALLLGKDLNCGCFGNEDRIGIPKLIIDVGLLLIIIYCLKIDLMKEKLSSKNQNTANNNI